MSKCFFCDMAGGEKPGLILEDDEFFSVYDKAPVSRGHALVIPKMHVDSFFDMQPEYASRLFRFLIATKRKIDERHRPDGYNIGVNDGAAAGRSIGHLHVHLIPRYERDVENPDGGIRNIFPVHIPPTRPPAGYA
jgi:diadenosine tetraphosphate (Ap4A) HIT family hydrolase